jgi:hypothetical protein
MFKLTYSSSEYLRQMKQYQIPMCCYQSNPILDSSFALNLVLVPAFAAFTEFVTASFVTQMLIRVLF